MAKSILQQVADRAGCSAAYVSLVLRGKRGKARTAKANIVLDVAAELGVTPESYVANRVQ